MEWSKSLMVITAYMNDSMYFSSSADQYFDIWPSEECPCYTLKSQLCQLNPTESGRVVCLLLVPPQNTSRYERERFHRVGLLLRNSIHFYIIPYPNDMNYNGTTAQLYPRIKFRLMGSAFIALFTSIVSMFPLISINLMNSMVFKASKCRYVYTLVWW